MFPHSQPRVHWNEQSGPTNDEEDEYANADNLDKHRSVDLHGNSHGRAWPVLLLLPEHVLSHRLDDAAGNDAQCDRCPIIQTARLPESSCQQALSAWKPADGLPVPLRRVPL